MVDDKHNAKDKPGSLNPMYDISSEPVASTLFIIMSGMSSRMG